MPDKREDLRKRLLAAAETRIARDGLARLRARDVTADAGSSLGGLYNAYDDLDTLVLAVGAQTLKRLHAALEEATADKTDPEAVLEALALGYATFARENYALWRALFDQNLEGREVPEWHYAEHGRLLDHILGPLAELRPGMAADRAAVRARTLFSAVHGIVSLSLEERFAAARPEELASELSAFVHQMVAGIRATRAVRPV